LQYIQSPALGQVPQILCVCVWVSVGLKSALLEPVSNAVDANLITFPFKPNAPWTTHQRRKKRKKIGNFSLDGSSHQTGDAAFTREPTTTHTTHTTRTQPSQACSGGHITPNPTQNRWGRCLFAYGEYKLMNTASKLGPHTQTDRGTCPGVGL
jgi:hypothetical protein